MSIAHDKRKTASTRLPNLDRQIAEAKREVEDSEGDLFD